MGQIEIKNLTFGFDTQLAYLFDHANLILDSQWKLGLIGRNGRGKTTLLRLLLGEYKYSGEITHTLSFTYFPQSISDKNQLTYYVLQAFGEFEQWKLERELTLLNMKTDILWQTFATLSGGEQTKVLLAVLFINESDLILIDEPTNHLDEQSRRQVADYLKIKKQGFILVSHDRNFLNEVIDHVLAIEKSKLVLYKGNFFVYEKQKDRKDNYEKEQNKKLKAEINRINTSAKDVSEWAKQRENISKDASSRRAAKKLAKRAKGIQKRTEEKKIEKEELLKDIEHIDRLNIHYLPNKDHNRLITAENFQLLYNRPLFQPLSFELNKGDRFAIQGSNGSGKSSIIQHFCGNFTGIATGSLWRAQNLSISLVRQNYEDNYGTLDDFAKRYHLSLEDLLSTLVKLGVERNVFHTKIEMMSMGQRKRVELAKSLVTPAELFIWDEPLNYLDVFNQYQIESLIQEIQPTMLIVEHDHHFIQKIATSTIDLNDQCNS